MVASLLLAYFLSRFFQARISQPRARARRDRERACRARRLQRARTPEWRRRVRDPDCGIQPHARAHRVAERRAARELCRNAMTAQTQAAEPGRAPRPAAADHAGHRRAPGPRSIFQVVVRSLEDNLPIDFGCICLYDATAADADGRERGSASAATRRRAGAVSPSTARADRSRTACRAACAGELVYEPDIARSLDSRFRSGSPRRDCARWSLRRCWSRARCSAC